MGSRVIIPEIVGEESQGRSRPVREGSRRTPQPPMGLGSLLRAVGAGVIVMAAVAAAVVLGGAILLFIAGLALVAWLGSLFGPRKGRRQTVVVRTTRSEGPFGSSVLIERRSSRDQERD